MLRLHFIFAIIFSQLQNFLIIFINYQTMSLVGLDLRRILFLKDHRILLFQFLDHILFIPVDYFHYIFVCSLLFRYLTCLDQQFASVDFLEIDWHLFHFDDLPFQLLRFFIDTTHNLVLMLMTVLKIKLALFLQFFQSTHINCQKYIYLLVFGVYFREQCLNNLIGNYNFEIILNSLSFLGLPSLAFKVRKLICHVRVGLLLDVPSLHLMEEEIIIIIRRQKTIIPKIILDSWSLKIFLTVSMLQFNIQQQIHLISQHYHIQHITFDNFMTILPIFSHFSPISKQIIQPKTAFQISNQQQFRQYLHQIKNNNNSLMPGLNSTINILKKLKDVFPDLSKRSKKGENGRIAVVGGSFQFTGAPFYSAISALRVGGDLSHIFCSKFSSPAIKSYSPEIIVHPLFVSEQQAKYNQQQTEQMLKQWTIKIKQWNKAIHSWIIGPGLGRDKYMQQFFPYLVKNIPNQSLVIFDADGIYYLCQYPHLFKQLQRFKAILTPNHRQLAYLQRFFKIDMDAIAKSTTSMDQVVQIPRIHALSNFKIIIKGPNDIILGKDRSFIVNTQGGKKRCGGIGDILAGVTSVCALWDFQYGPALASRIVRKATKAAFEKEGRGLTAPCVIKQLAETVKNIQNEIL